MPKIGEEAIVALKRSLQLQRDPETHFNLSLAYLSTADYRQAEAQLDAALALRPFMAVAWKYKARVFTARDARAQARNAYTRSLQLDPLDTSAYGELVTLLREMGELSEAQRYLELGIRVSRTPAVLRTRAQRSAVD